VQTPPLPFLNFLSGAVALDNVPVLFDDASDGWFRYGDLRETIKKLSPFLQSTSPLRQRELILGILPRTISSVAAYLTAASLGHALLLVDPDAKRPDLFIEAYEPEWIILPTPIKPGDAYLPVDWPVPDLFLWKRVIESKHDIHPDLFLLLLPPGPPDSVKTVRLSYTNILHNTLASLEAMKLSPQDRGILIMPLSYSFGLSIVHMILTVGGSLLLSEMDVKNRLLWNMAQKREVTLFAGIPFHYEYIVRAGLDNLHVPRLKTFLQAGGRMPLERTQEMLRQINERNGAFFVLYGQTEASPRITYLPLHEFPDKIGSLGKLIKDGHMTFQERLMIYHGPNVMMGYAHKREDLGFGDKQNGELIIPEQGKIDEEGFIYIEY
jgi:acyl-CoA synthetase (AMP-forming)/AMP-acid ligase II